MRIHLIAPGFTPEVFTHNTTPMFRTGVDKLISVHTPYPDEETRIKVENTLQKIEETLKLKVEKRILHEKIFSSLVQELRHLLNEFGDYDEIYLHLEGGERHVCLAMVYASLFVKKKIHILFATEYGKGGKEYQFEQMPPIPAYELSKNQEKILRLVAGKDGQTLTELSARINAEDTSKVAPGVLRQLKSLYGLNLISVGQNGKKIYSITAAGRLFL